VCATCDAYFCQLFAKLDAYFAAVRPAIATGNVQLATGTFCSRVLTNGTGSQVTGVALRQGSVEFVVNTQIVVVSVGLEETAALLRRSRTSKHPEGLGNNFGCLGRYLGGHSAGTIFPLVSWTPIPPIHTKTFAMNEYYGGAPHWPYPLGVVQVAGQLPFWEEVSWLMRPLAHLIGTHSLMCFYMSEALPTYDSGVIFDGDRAVGSIAPAHNTRTFEKLRLIARDMFHRAGYWTVARRRAPTLWHPVGTARMGVDHRCSVVDANCRVHEIEGLFVADASVLPSAGSVNPALTIIALALRAGDFIAGLRPLLSEGRTDSAEDQLR
jgi:choline dehydrogenase-like flavoprotein